MYIRNREKVFNFDKDDLHMIRTFKNVIRQLLKHPQINPLQIIGLGNALYCLDRLPRITPGAHCEINVIYDGGDETYMEKQYNYFKISESYLEISKMLSVHHAAGSDTESGPRWKIEADGYKEKDRRLNGIERDIIRYLRLGAKITVDDSSQIDYDVYTL